MAIKKKSPPKKAAKAFTDVTKKEALDGFRVVRDILALVDVTVTIKQLQERTTAEVLAAEHWAATEHLRANDHKLRREPKPRWLPPSGTEKKLVKR